MFRGRLFTAQGAERVPTFGGLLAHAGQVDYGVVEVRSAGGEMEIVARHPGPSKDGQVRPRPRPRASRLINRASQTPARPTTARLARGAVPGSTPSTISFALKKRKHQMERTTASPFGEAMRGWGRAFSRSLLRRSARPRFGGVAFAASSRRRSGSARTAFPGKGRLNYCHLAGRPRGAQHVLDHLIGWADGHRPRAGMTDGALFRCCRA